MTKSAAALMPTEMPAQTTKVTINLHGRDYVVACDAGEEKKLTEIVKLVDGKLRDIAGKNGTNATETRLFMLTCLMLADELMETRRLAGETRKSDEDLYVAAVDHLRQRVESIASRIGRA